jgi:hypothetical protein
LYLGAPCIRSTKECNKLAVLPSKWRYVGLVDTNYKASPMEIPQGRLVETRWLLELFGAHLFVLVDIQFWEHPRYQNARKDIPHLYYQIHSPGLKTVLHATALRQQK